MTTARQLAALITPLATTRDQVIRRRDACRSIRQHLDDTQHTIQGSGQTPHIGLAVERLVPIDRRLDELAAAYDDVAGVLDALHEQARVLHPQLERAERDRDEASAARCSALAQVGPGIGAPAAEQAYAAAQIRVRELQTSWRQVHRAQAARLPQLPGAGTLQALAWGTLDGVSLWQGSRTLGRAVVSWTPRMAALTSRGAVGIPVRPTTLVLADRLTTTTSTIGQALLRQLGWPALQRAGLALVAGSQRLERSVRRLGELSAAQAALVSGVGDQPVTRWGRRLAEHRAQLLENSRAASRQLIRAGGPLDGLRRTATSLARISAPPLERAEPRSVLRIRADAPGASTLGPVRRAGRRLADRSAQLRRTAQPVLHRGGQLLRLGGRAVAPVGAAVGMADLVSGVRDGDAMKATTGGMSLASGALIATGVLAAASLPVAAPALVATGVALGVASAGTAAASAISGWVKGRKERRDAER